MRILLCPVTALNSVIMLNSIASSTNRGTKHIVTIYFLSESLPNFIYSKTNNFVVVVNDINLTSLWIISPRSKIARKKSAHPSKC